MEGLQAKRRLAAKMPGSSRPRMSYSGSLDRRTGDDEGPFTRSDETMTTTLFPAPRAADRAVGGTRGHDLIDQLSPREREVLALMAEGRSNRAIGEQLTVQLKTVETHVSRVFTKLGLGDDRYENRRVLAVLMFFGRASTDAAV
jgi:DNA-binding NarL/FixJ family response regulator